MEVDMQRTCGPCRRVYPLRYADGDYGLRRAARPILLRLFGRCLRHLSMLIMRLPEMTLAKSLVTASLSLLVYATMVSFHFGNGCNWTLAITATYAVVLSVDLL